MQMISRPAIRAPASGLPPRGLLRGLVALVWLHEGLWLKLLGRSRHQLDVVAAAPGLSGAAGAAALAVIGGVETAIALWVLSGRRPRLAAASGAALLLALNAAGIAFARGLIPDPPGMVIKNLAFLALAWCAAAGRPEEGRA
jgi:uncharacterized membrane protein YphA (DoxX/SURF4 family)